MVIVVFAATQGFVIEEHRFIETSRGLIEAPLNGVNPEALIIGTGKRLYQEAMGTLQGRLNFQTILTAVAFLLNAIYFYMRNRVKRLIPFIRLQLTLDVLTYAGVIYNTGGSLSPFVFLFYFPIISAGILQSFRLSIIITTVSAIVYGIITLLPTNNLFSPLLYLSPSSGFFTLTLVIHIFSFFLIDFLVGYLLRLIRQREKQLQRSNRVLTDSLHQLGAIFEVAEVVTPGTSFSSVISGILKILLERFGLQRVLYFSVNDKENLVRIRQVLPENPALLGQEFPLRNEAGEPAGIIATCALTRQSMNIEDPAHDPRINRTAMSHIGTNPFAVVPIVINGNVVGVLGADRSAEARSIPDEHFKLLIMFANQAALAFSQNK